MVLLFLVAGSGLCRQGKVADRVFAFDRLDDEDGRLAFDIGGRHHLFRYRLTVADFPGRLVEADRHGGLLGENLGRESAGSIREGVAGGAVASGGIEHQCGTGERFSIEGNRAADGGGGRPAAKGREQGERDPRECVGDSHFH